MHFHPEQKLYTKEQLEEINPSRKDGIDAVKEKMLRNTNITLMDDAAKQLKLPLWTVYTARYFHHRYFVWHSYKRNDRFLLSTACLFLASKVNDTPRALKDVCQACHLMRYKNKDEMTMKWEDLAFQEKLKDDVLLAEQAILYAIDFNFNIQLPYSFIMKALHKLGVLTNPQLKQIGQVAVNFGNDSSRTTLSLQYSAEHLAMGAIYMAFCFCKKNPPLPEGQHLADYFKVEARVLEDIMAQIMEVYVMPGHNARTHQPAHHSVERSSSDAAALPIKSEHAPSTTKADGGITTEKVLRDAVADESKNDLRGGYDGESTKAGVAASGGTFSVKEEKADVTGTSDADRSMQTLNSVVQCASSPLFTASPVKQGETASRPEVVTEEDTEAKIADMENASAAKGKRTVFCREADGCKGMQATEVDKESASPVREGSAVGIEDGIIEEHCKKRKVETVAENGIY